MIVYEFFKAILIIIVTSATAWGSLTAFDNAGLIFPDGIENADGYDWGITFCIVVLTLFVSCIVGGTLSMILY